MLVFFKKKSVFCRIELVFCKTGGQTVRLDERSLMAEFRLRFGLLVSLEFVFLYDVLYVFACVESPHFVSHVDLSYLGVGVGTHVFGSFNGLVQNFLVEPITEKSFSPRIRSANLRICRPAFSLAAKSDVEGDDLHLVICC